ncbi:MAG: class I SAM-dependent methyltransferase [Beijerinckiaceae bacterium]|nr:class I SAM-dependent methyltransferase [Beijerinckiaceae bacterium]
MQKEAAGYALGHSGSELTRLQKQAEFYAEFTRNVLLKAGLQAGMRVLDVGCGAGDVSIEAARIVGDAGEVIGIDQSSAALEMATRRAGHAGFRHAHFRRADLRDLQGERAFDAVIGRFILLHVQDPGAALATMTQYVRAGGAIAFIEMDLSSAQVTPPLALFDDALGWIRDAYIREGVEINMGSRLFACYEALGLSPAMEAFQRIEGGEHAHVYEYLAETVRSLLPRMIALGVVTHDAVQVDTLAARAKQAAVAGRHCFFYPRMVGAWARKP